MKTRLAFFRRSSVVLGVGALLGLSISAQAVTVTYNINSALSSLTLSGQAFTIPMTVQSAGSDVAFFKGTITADLTGGVLTFTGGSLITAILNPGAPYSHFPGAGVNGIENYGVTCPNTFVPALGAFVQVNGVYRDLSLDITAGTAQNGLAASGMTLGFTGASALDYGILANGSPFQASTSLLNSAGDSGANTSASLISLSLGTGTYGDTLTLPVSLHTTGSNRDQFWNGTLVAVVPEPSSMALIGLGLLGLVTFRRIRSH
jgi:hypothetical protein